MDDVIGCNWLLTQLNGLKVEEKENYNSKFLCQNATCIAWNKRTKKTIKKAKKKSSFFLQKTKKNSRSNWKWLLYVTHQINQYTKPILLRHLDVLTKKKIKLKIRNRKSLIVHHPKTHQKNNPNSWIRTTPALNNCIFVCRCLFLSKKIPSCTLTKRNEWTHHAITQSAAPKSIIIHAVP